MPTPVTTPLTSVFFKTDVVSTPQETAGDTVWITFEKDHFVPDRVTISAGTKVIWKVSEDYADHWVVCPEVPFRGWLYEWFPLEHIFNEPGVYHYYDDVNPTTATGTIIVVSP